MKMVNAATKAAQAAESDTAEAGRAIDCLRKLEKMEVSLKLLAATQAGKAVKRLSKGPVPNVAAAAAAVVATWKKAVGGGESQSMSVSNSASDKKSLHRSNSSASTLNSTERSALESLAAQRPTL